MENPDRLSINSLFVGDNMKVFKKNKDEIFWNVVNCALASSLVFLGACASGDITTRGIFVAVVAGLTAFVVKFKDYWAKEESEYSNKLFSFV